MNKKVAILMAVHNGQHWLGPVLDSVVAQSYGNIELAIWDNNSTDAALDTIRGKLATRNWKLENSPDNIGFWAGMEKLIAKSDASYIICLTDVILDPHFVERAVAVLESHPDAGALQAKILQPDGTTIDTTGFEIFRSRRIINRGHGEKDHGQYDRQEEIFAVEGAVPVFRRSALEDCRIDGWIVDPAYRVGSFGYGDDLDLTWRMHVFGWKQLYAPNVIGYHDRSTTKGTSRNTREYLSRTKIRRLIPLAKRRLDWSNTRFTIIKNDYMIGILRDLPYIAAREIAVLGYTLLFEPVMLAEAARFVRLLPTMIKRRRWIMARAVASAAAMHSFFHS